MNRSIRRTFLGTLALATLVGCGVEAPAEEQQESTKQGLVDRPDFVVIDVTAPTSVQSGQSLTAQVVVCNQGTLADLATTELYLSADGTIRPYTGGPWGPEDSRVAGGSTGVLNPGQCVTLTLSGNAYPPRPYITPGSYYLAAVVDPYNYVPELVENNNTRVDSIISLTP